MKEVKLILNRNTILFDSIMQTTVWLAMSIILNWLFNPLEGSALVKLEIALGNALGIFILFKIVVLIFTKKFTVVI